MVISLIDAPSSAIIRDNTEWQRSEIAWGVIDAKIIVTSTR